MSASHTGGWLHTLFASLTPDQLALVNFVLRKLTHIVAYGIEGALAVRAMRGNWIAAVAIAASVAIVDESLQAATALRGGNVWDVLLDSVAATVVSFIRRTR